MSNKYRVELEKIRRGVAYVDLYQGSPEGDNWIGDLEFPVGTAEAEISRAVVAALNAFDEMQQSVRRINAQIEVKR